MGSITSFDEVIVSYFESVDAGEEVDLDVLLSGYPQHAERLQKFFSNVARVREVVQFGGGTSRKLGVAIGSGDSLGKYTVEEMVGRGAFGCVFRATDQDLDRTVAVRIPLSLDDPDRMLRFRAEATTVAKLDHPRIVTVYEANFSDDLPYIASAFYSGPDLACWLDAQRGPVSGRDAAQFIAELADAVHYAHERGVLHRDIKPSNVLLQPAPGTERTRVKTEGHHCLEQSLKDFVPALTDFGLAKLLGGVQDTRSSQIVGTPLYMAPEQLVSAEASTETDVYSLGVVLYELLTLQVPFPGRSYIEVLDRVRQDHPRSPVELNHRIDFDLATICLKCLEKEGADRYETAGALRDDLLRYSSDRPIHACRTSRLTRFRRWCRKPKRVTDAGTAMYRLQIFVLLWLVLLLLGGMWIGAIGGELVERNIKDVGFISTTLHLPLLALGWFLARGKRWAFWPSTIGSVLMVAIFVVSGTQESVAFEYNYPNAMSKLTTFVALTMGSLWVAALHLFAIPASRHARADREQTQSPK